MTSNKLSDAPTDDLRRKRRSILSTAFRMTDEGALDLEISQATEKAKSEGTVDRMMEALKELARSSPLVSRFLGSRRSLSSPSLSLTLSFLQTQKVDKNYYEDLTITRASKLLLVLKKLQGNKSLRSQVLRLHIPGSLELDLPQMPGGASLEVDVARRQVTTAIMQILTLVTDLETLELHSDAVQSTSFIAVPALPNLLSLKQLALPGQHDSKWLSLLKYATNVTDLQVSPFWSEKDGLPFSMPGKLDSLALVKGKAMPPAQFRQLLTNGGISLRSLKLIDVSSLYADEAVLEEAFKLVAPTLEALTVTSSDSTHDEVITEALTATLPSFSKLGYLHTTAYSLTIIPATVRTLVLSLPNVTEAPEKEVVLNTAKRLLDGIIQGPQFELNFVDVPMSHFLAFNLKGTHDYGTSEDVFGQSMMWMKASHMGVVITVKRLGEGTLVAEMMPTNLL